MNERDDKAFENLIAANQLRLLAVIARMTNGSPDSEDILQRVCLRLWEQRADFRPEKPFLAWGRAVAYYEVMAWRKTQARERLVFSDDIVALLGEEPAAPEAEENRQLVYLEQCVGGLSGEMRRLLDLHYREGLDLATIARRLGRSAHSVANTLYYLRGVLRGCVESKVKEEERP